MILYVLGGIVAGLAALLFPQSTSFLAANVRIACKQVSHCVVSSIVNDSGLLKKLSPINTQGCNVIRSPFLNGCEDMHLVGSKLVLSCAVDLEERHAYFPPTDKNDMTVFSHGRIVLYDITDKSITPLSFGDWDQEFAPHGISVWSNSSDSWTIFVVNHKRSGSVVDLFELNVETSSLKHVETVSDQSLLPSPNNIVAVGPRSFYATNDYACPRFSKCRLFEKVFQRRWGWVVFRGKDGIMKKVARDLSMPNGIAVSPNGEKVAVSSTTISTVFLYERREDNRLRLREHVKAPMLLDNLWWDSKDNSLFMTGHPSMLGFFAAERNYNVTSPSQVVVMRENTGHDQYFGKRYNLDTIFLDHTGSLVSAGTIAVPYFAENLIYVSGVFSKGVAVCPMHLK